VSETTPTVEEKSKNLSAMSFAEHYAATLADDADALYVALYVDIDDSEAVRILRTIMERRKSLRPSHTK